MTADRLLRPFSSDPIPQTASCSSRMVSFKSLTTDAGLVQLNAHLLTRSYIEGYQASRDDLAAYSAIAQCPDAKKYPHAARWWNHVKALLGAW